MVHFKENFKKVGILNFAERIWVGEFWGSVLRRQFDQFLCLPIKMHNGYLLDFAACANAGIINIQYIIGVQYSPN